MPKRTDIESILIIGAGPSGLSAAYHLTRLGHTVEIREAGPLAGGMMHFGIPAYRLPRNILHQEVERIEKMGVNIVLNHKVEDVLAEQTAGKFDAVFIAVGAHIGKKTGIPARDAGQDGAEMPVVLLSPACASYDQYRNFELRGQAFIEAARALPDFEGR